MKNNSQFCKSFNPNQTGGGGGRNALPGIFCFITLWRLIKFHEIW